MPQFAFPLGPDTLTGMSNAMMPASSRTAPTSRITRLIPITGLLSRWSTTDTPGVKGSNQAVSRVVPQRSWLFTQAPFVLPNRCWSNCGSSTQRHRRRDIRTVRTEPGQQRLVVGLEVVAASADSVSHPSHDHQHQADHQENETDSPQHGDLEYKSCDQNDDSKNDHGVHLVSISSNRM